MQDDRAIVLVAVQEDWMAHHFGTREVQKDEGIKGLVRNVMEKDGRALENASEEMKTDPEVVLAAVKQSPMALKFAAERMKEDRAIVMAAVQHHGMALQHAANELKEDEAIVLASLNATLLKNPHMYGRLAPNWVESPWRYISAEMKRNERVRKLTGM
jgi:hypothetical protein